MPGMRRAILPPSKLCHGARWSSNAQDIHTTCNIIEVKRYARALLLTSLSLCHHTLSVEREEVDAHIAINPTSHVDVKSVLRAHHSNRLRIRIE